MAEESVLLERRALALFEELLDLPEEDRLAALDARAADDAELHQRVASLLGHATDELERLGGIPRLGAFLDESEDSTDNRPKPGTRIGGFELLRFLARGGMGWVYEARQLEPRRRVAVKLLRQGLDSSEARRRFRYESAVLAHLVHPSIAQVYEAGTHREETALGTSEVPFFALEFVEGARSITRYVREEELPREDVLRLFAEVCDAISFGHQKGVIHRDLKPDNVLVDLYGRPKVIDFGVARATDPDLDTSSVPTRAGQLIGTVQYMSPEQLEGNPGDVDTRSDVHALGVLLYELLCGRLPFDLEGCSLAAAARIIEETEPTRPRSVVPDLEPDLEAILLHALEKDRERRYASAHGLAKDLRRFLNHEPVQAAAPSRLRYLYLFARRNRVAALSAGLLAVVLVAATAISLLFATEASAALERSEVVESSLLDFSEELTGDFVERMWELGASVELRAELVRMATRRLDEVRAEAEDDPQVLASLAHSYLRLSTLSINPYVGHIGDVEGGRRSLERAETILAQLQRVAPDDDETLRLEALVLRQYASLPADPGGSPGSREKTRRSVEILEGLVARHPDDLQLRGELACALYEFAYDHHSDIDELFALLARCEEIFSELLEHDLPPRVAVSYRSNLASVFHTRGQTHSVMGNHAAALADARRAYEGFQEVQRANPTEGHQMSLLQTMHSLGIMLEREGLVEEALAMCQRAVDEVEALVQADPDNALVLEDAAGFQVWNGRFRWKHVDRMPTEQRRAEAGRALESIERGLHHLDELGPAGEPAWSESLRSLSRELIEQILARYPDL